MNATERRQAKGEKPGQLKIRGYGPKPKSYRSDSLPPPEAIAKAKTAFIKFSVPSIKSLKNFFLTITLSILLLFSC